MTEYEAYSLIVELQSLAHALGEGLWNRVELLVGFSSGLIVMAYVAPERLKIGVTTFVLSMYALFCVFYLTNIYQDAVRASATIEDARLIAETYNLSIETLNIRVEEGQARAELTGPFFMLSLMLGTIVYVAFTCFKNYRK